MWVTTISREGWVAEVLTSPQPKGFESVYCTTRGDSRDLALEAATYVLGLFALGRAAFIRAKPEAHSETDFDTKNTHHKGFVRFSYCVEGTGDSEWHYPEPDLVVGFGAVA